MGGGETPSEKHQGKPCAHVYAYKYKISAKPHPKNVISFDGMHSVVSFVSPSLRNRHTKTPSRRKPGQAGAHDVTHKAHMGGSDKDNGEGNKPIGINLYAGWCIKFS